MPEKEWLAMASEAMRVLGLDKPMNAIILVIIVLIFLGWFLDRSR